MGELIIDIQKIITLLQEDENLTTDDVKEFVLEELQTKLLSKEEKVLLKRTSVRRQMLEKCGKDAFLLPDQLKFPIVSPLSKNCNPDCRLLFAAYLRANEWSKKKPEYKKIAEKAKKLYEKNKCELKIKVKIHENGIIDIEEFFELI